MALKGAVRRRQVFKTQCLAERCHGDSQEACIALRGTDTLAYLAYDASQSSPKPNACLGSKIRHVDIPAAMWKEAQTHLFTLCRYWGAAESGWGS